MKSNYMTRAMNARDPRFAKIATSLGYGRRDMVAADPLDHDGDGKKGGSSKPAASDELTETRAEYERVLGKRPFMGWNLDTLRLKIAAAKTEV